MRQFHFFFHVWWQILEKVKTAYDLPIVTDVHETVQVNFYVETLVLCFYSPFCVQALDFLGGITDWIVLKVMLQCEVQMMLLF